MSKYEGNFVMNLKDGYGVMIWNTGGKYSGYFQNNLRHGQGKMVWSNGTVYQGGWANGNQDGLGQQSHEKFGNQIGIFKDNTFIKDQSFVYDGMHETIYSSLKNTLKKKEI